MFSIRPLIFVVLATAMLPPAVRGQGPAPAGAEPGAELSVYLLTVGQGDLVWEKFGHNGIWIHDPVRGTDRVYHYGLFDFHSPGYWSRFVKGDWIYQMGVDDVRQWVGAYEYYNRPVVAQELDLTPTQRVELQAFLEWNARPENREYLYDYYRDNCSTRVRDVLDRVLGGRLRAATADEPSGATYRWHSRRLIADDELTYAGMNAGLGPAADREISRWEEMFLPEKVRERVREVSVVGPDGEARPLVRSERALVQAVGRAPERATPPEWTPAFLLLGLGVAGALVALARGAGRSRAARFAFAAVAALWTLLVGFGGLLLVGLWAFTNHTIAHRNENLFQFDPLALGLVILVPALAYGARWAARPARWLALAVAALSVLGFVLQLLPGLDQVNGEVIALLLPAHLALAWAVWWVGRERGTGNRVQGTPTAPAAARRGASPRAPAFGR